MAVKPLADRVLIKPIEAAEEKKGGIIIPDTAKEKPVRGEVIEVGTGRQTEEGKVIPMTVKKGDKILYGKYSGTEISIDNEEMLIMRESDVLAIIN
ncbi:MAG: co-chaperone GroES [Candidatus Zixiibacteriota bacterium]